MTFSEWEARTIGLAQMMFDMLASERKRLQEIMDKWGPDVVAIG